MIHNKLRYVVNQINISLIQDEFIRTAIIVMPNNIDEHNKNTSKNKYIFDNISAVATFIHII